MPVLDDDQVHSLVHELRTPLAIVSACAEILERRGDELTAEQHKEFAGRILVAARELGGVLDGLTSPPTAS